MGMQKEAPRGRGVKLYYLLPGEVNIFCNTPVMADIILKIKAIYLVAGSIYQWVVMVIKIY